MEVKLSVSSSRRISFASDLKNYECDLELEELENERDNPTGKYSNRKRSLYTFSNENDENDDDEDFHQDYGNVNIIKLKFKSSFMLMKLNHDIITRLQNIPTKLE